MTGECVSCGKTRHLHCRGLCETCRWRYRSDGTITEFGYVKADRIADYAARRRAGASVPVAAARTGVCERTGWRYEAELKDAARSAGWPAARTEAA